MSNGTTTPLRDARPDLPDPFIHLVEWALAPDPAARIGSAGTFEAELSRTLGRVERAPAAKPAAHQAAPVGVHSMNSGLVEARELATRMTRILREGGAPSLLEEFASEAHEAWQWLVGAGREGRALPGADPWVREARARIVASIPSSGEDVEPLLKQIGLTAAP